MKINLNDPQDFNLHGVRQLIASVDDSTHRQLQVRKDGTALISDTPCGGDKPGLALCVETWSAGSGLVGPAAARDSDWVKRIYEMLKANWPEPIDTYIDDY